MKLRDYLMENKITQTAFAKRLGVDRAYLNLVIHGNKRPGKYLSIAISMMTCGVVGAEDLRNGGAAYKGNERSIFKKDNPYEGLSHYQKKKAMNHDNSSPQKQKGCNARELRQ